MHRSFLLLYSSRLVLWMWPSVWGNEKEYSLDLIKERFFWMASSSLKPCQMVLSTRPKLWRLCRVLDTWTTPPTAGLDTVTMCGMISLKCECYTCKRIRVDFSLVVALWASVYHDELSADLFFRMLKNVVASFCQDNLFLIDARINITCISI